MAILSDHWLDDDVNSDLKPFPSDRRSVCMHPVPDNVQSTTSSVVADLWDDGSRLPVYWCCLYSPCMGVFFPIFLEGLIPGLLQTVPAGLTLLMVRSSLSPVRCSIPYTSSAIGESGGYTRIFWRHGSKQPLLASGSLSNLMGKSDRCFTRES